VLAFVSPNVSLYREHAKIGGNDSLHLTDSEVAQAALGENELPKIHLLDRVQFDSQRGVSMSSRGLQFNYHTMSQNVVKFLNHCSSSGKLL
jgi:hypothetical protein